MKYPTKIRLCRHSHTSRKDEFVASEDVTNCTYLHCGNKNLCSIDQKKCESVLYKRSKLGGLICKLKS
jgi:hypothetical protein